ncbi:MAG: pilus assembly protein CpaC, partial [Isosphaeraceae bacterium]|nr:pilus assembly protein CpaC [Isosphaeraceae bacterium]
PDAGAAVVGGSGLGTLPARSGGGGLTPGTIINRVHVPGPRQVLLKVKIAELNRSALRQIGIDWLETGKSAFIGSAIGGIGTFAGAGSASQTARGPVARTGATSVAFNGQSQLYGIFDAGTFNLFLNALRQNTLAKILAEPELVTLDGQPAHFLAGGSFPYPVPQTTTAGGVAITINFRDFGAILQFLPHILANDVIRLDVSPAFSQLDPNTGTSVLGTTVPGVTQRSARTVVEMREGQTLAIAGLLQYQTTASTARVPLLGDLPVVGPAFSRNEIRTIETELVVLVTPELVAPVEQCDVPPSPGDRVLEPNDCEFYTLGRIEGRTGRPFRATIHELDPFYMSKHFRSENRWVVGPHGHAD